MKILFFDIETAPMDVKVFGLWNQNIGLNQIVTPTRMLSFAAKWKDGPVGFHASRNKVQHKRMIQRMHSLLDEADVVVHYYGERFDVPHVNREFVELGLGPVSPYVQVDLKKVAKQFYLPSYKLQYVSTWLGFDGKTAHSGFNLWVDCLKGDPEAWAKMEEYNRQDVVLLEQVFDKLRPWIKSLPSVALYMDDPEETSGCPACGSQNLIKKGFRVTKLSKYQAYLCKDCTKYSQSGKAIKRVDLR